VTAPPLSLFQQLTWPTHGWSLHPSTRGSRAAATSWLDLATNDELKQWEEKRRTKARAAVAQVLDEIGVPLEEIHPAPTPSPADVIHLPTSTREQIRSVRGLKIPAERTIIKCKRRLAVTHATGTATFANGAYLTDPIRFVTGLCLQSSMLAVGGDTGDELTKLGVTYVQGEQQKFAALLVFHGSDKYDDLDTLQQVGITPFNGHSQHLSSIWAVLQRIIDLMKAFLNGDWPFINGVLGLMAPSATHPCPICIISFNSFTKSARYRQPGDKHSVDLDHSALLTISPERIVPTPLHLFLGISNRIILDAFSELFSAELVEETLEKVKTIHSAGCGGRSDIFQLNGPEIRKWMKQDCSTALRTAAEKGGNLTADQKSTFSILKRWLENLHDHLLHKKEWTAKQIEEWRAAVDDLQKNWSTTTSQSAFPKLHMLRHSLEFAERHRILGRVSEAQIESYHYQFKVLFHRQHLNSAHNEAQRICRSLVDTSLRAVQPLLQQ
jgi:hypothetical protein